MNKEKKIDLVILAISVVLFACTSILFNVFSSSLSAETGNTFWRLLYVKYGSNPLTCILLGYSLGTMFVYAYLGKEDKINKRLGIFLLCVAILLILLKLDMVIAYFTGSTYLGANIEELIFNDSILHKIWYYLLDHSWWSVFPGILISLVSHLSEENKKQN